MFRGQTIGVGGGGEGQALVARGGDASGKS